MRRFLPTAVALAALATVSVSVPERAKAATITFNSVPSVNNPILTTLTTDGYTFTSTHFHTIDSPGIVAFGGGVSNGTIYIMEEAGGLGGPITMAQVGGGTFSLTGLDAARPFMDNAAAASGGYPNADFLYVVGNVFGGGTVTASLALALPTAFTTLALPSNFVNLTSVTFSGTLTGGGPGGIALDNIRVNETAAVPEPSAVIGLSTGLIGLGLAWRARRRRGAA